MGKKIGHVIIFDDEKHPIKVWLDGRFFGSSDEVECLIWDSYKLKDKYDDLEFTYIHAGELFDDEKYYDDVYAFLTQCSYMDKTEQKLVIKKEWDTLYRYHKNQEWGE